MRTIILLTISSIFMTLAWYRHLKYKDKTRRYGWQSWRVGALPLSNTASKRRPTGSDIMISL
jgi:hypothetical protein